MMYTPKPTPSTKVKIGKSGANAGWWVLRDAIADGSEFTNSNGSFRGERVENVTLPWGHRLPTDAEKVFRSCGAEIDYVIYSYGTPIAWHTREFTNNTPAWWLPSARYSVTTSNHQGKAHVAIGNQPTGSAFGGDVVQF